jgi:hypothetical protein
VCLMVSGLKCGKFGLRSPFSPVSAHSFEAHLQCVVPELCLAVYGVYLWFCVHFPMVGCALFLSQEEEEPRVPFRADV